MQKLPYPVLPVCDEIEKRVIGALIFTGKSSSLSMQKAMLLLDNQCLYNISARLIFELINSRFEENKDFDFVSLSPIIDPANELFFLSLQEQFFTGNMLNRDVDELIKYKTLRNQIKILIDVTNDAIFHRDPEIALKVISEDLQKLNYASTSISENIVKSYEQCIDEALSDTENDRSLIYTQIPNLPAIPNRALITIAGRSGHGKTFFALYLMDKIIEALEGKQSLYFNLEMHPTVMLQRHATIIGEKGKDSRELISNAAHKLLQKDVYMVSLPMITIDEIESICRISALKKPIGAIIVDYLGLITSKSKSDAKYLEQNNIAKRLAALAMTLDCVVICLIQVNREFKTRASGDRCPVTTDAADAMGSVHSSSWWLGIDQPFLDNDEPEFKNVFQIRCRKNRTESGNFKLDLHFDGTFSKIDESRTRKPFAKRKHNPEDIFSRD